MRAAIKKLNQYVHLKKLRKHKFKIPLYTNLPLKIIVKVIFSQLCIMSVLKQNGFQPVKPNPLK